MTQKVTLVKAESPGSPEIPLNVDSSGNIGVNVESGGSGGGSGGVVQVSDGTTKTQLLAVDANGKIGVNALPSITGAVTTDVGAIISGSKLPVSIASMPSTAVTNTGLSNIDTSLNTLFTSTGIKIASWPASVGVTNTGLSNIDTSLNTLFTSTGIKVATLPAISDTVLTAVEDQTTHYLGVKDVVLTAIEDQTTHYIGVKDVAHAPITGTLQNAATGTGVGTPLTITGQKMVAIQVTSTVVGSITYDFEVSVDGTNFMTGIDAVDMLGADHLGSITQTGAGTWIYQIMCAGIAKIQCNITANGATGGTSVTVTAQAVA